jgi:hypothetical protein
MKNIEMPSVKGIYVVASSLTEDFICLFDVVIDWNQTTEWRRNDDELSSVVVVVLRLSASGIEFLLLSWDSQQTFSISIIFLQQVFKTKQKKG